jgi:hypothetical protein
METVWKRNSAKILRKKRAKNEQKTSKKRAKKGQKRAKKGKKGQKRAIDFYCEIVLINAVKNK